jgi:multidrug efflux system membrane fusion protein
MNTTTSPGLLRLRRAAAPALALALAIALAACTRGEANDAAPAGPMPVPVAAPELRSIPLTIDLPGHVEAIERVELRPRVGGFVTRIAFREGARVQKGELLVQIDPAPYAAALAAAEANLRQAEAETRLAAGEAARARRLAEREALSTEEAERRAAQVDIASARRDAARAAVARAQLDLRHASVVAPIDGRIGRAEITTGNLVGQDDLLAVLVADDRVYVRFDVSEAVLGAHDHAQWTAEFVLPENPDQRFHGELAFLENELQAGTGTVRARVALPGDPALVPGRYGQLRLKLGEREKALLINETAIGADQGTRYVLVVDGDGTVQYRPITTGARIGHQRVVEAGLASADRIVVAGLIGVRPGMKVAPQDTAAIATTSRPVGGRAHSEE